HLATAAGGTCVLRRTLAGVCPGWPGTRRQCGCWHAHPVATANGPAPASTHHPPKRMSGPVEKNFPVSETAPRRVGGSGVRAQAHSRLLQSCCANHGIDASDVRVLRCSPASVRRRTDTRAAGPAHAQAWLGTRGAGLAHTQACPCPPARSDVTATAVRWRPLSY